MEQFNNNSTSHHYNKIACLFHLLYFANFIIPFSGLLSLIIIRACRDDITLFLAEQWREALNFQISMLIYGILFTLLVFVIIGIPLLGLLFLFSVIMPIIAAIKVLDGKSYKYFGIFRII